MQKSIGFVFTCFFAVSSASWAQQAIEEVVITARKIDETIIDIPVSVSAITGEKMANFGISDISGIAKQTPNVSFSDAGGARLGGPAITIRGIGTNARTLGFEQSVGLGFDGIFVSDSSWMLASVFDTQQVEVLRGPQGTFFGKNTTAGMINFKSRGPRDELEANIDVSFNPEYSGSTIEAGIGGPLTDNFGARIAVRQSEGDGYVNNTNFGFDGPQYDEQMARLSLSLIAGDSVDISTKSLIVERESEGSPYEVGGCNAAGLITIQVLSPTENCVLDDRTEGGLLPLNGQIGDVTGRRNIAFTDLEASLHTINFNWDISDDTSLQFVSGYSDMNNQFAVDNDHLTVRGVGILFSIEQTIISQELRLTTTLTDNIDLTAGIYYDDIDSRYLATGDVAVVAYLAANDVDSSSIAEFLQATIQITDSVELSLGGRYTVADKDVSNRTVYNVVGAPISVGPNVPASFPALLTFQTGSQTDDRTDEHFTPSIVVNWAFIDHFDLPWLDDGRLYASYKEGFKAGGYDVITKQDTEFFEYEDEYVKGYELGGKLEMFDGQLRTNFAFFYSTYDDLQVQTIVPVLEVLTLNAASATVRGLEIDGQFTASDSLSFTFGLAWTKAVYADFSLAPCNQLQVIGELDGCGPEIGPGGIISDFQDLSGEPLVGAPKITTSIGFDYSIPVGESGMYWNLGMQTAFRDESNTVLDNDPNLVREAHWDVSAYTALSLWDGQLDLSLIGKNLLDERVISASEDHTLILAAGSLIPVTGYEISRNAPRTFVFQAKYRY